MLEPLPVTAQVVVTIGLTVVAAAMIAAVYSLVLFFSLKVLDPTPDHEPTADIVLKLTFAWFALALLGYWVFHFFSPMVH